MATAAGEIYFIGEKDLRSKEVTPYFKVGIVRENAENADRDSTQRLLEHQTGNPRELYIESVWLNNPHSFDIPVRVLIAS
jgi:hypothetical protein